MTKAITQPGRYEIDEVAYHADPVEGGSLSSSGARRLLPPSCPAKFAYDRAHGRPPKRAFDFGRAAHARVLGVGDGTVLIDAANYRTAAAQDARDKAHADGKAPILPAEDAAINAMAKALGDHPYAGALFDPTRGKAEQTLVWTDSETGVACRARLDWLPEADNGRLIVADYKTANAADPASISRSLHEYGYGRQAPWYLDGVAALSLASSAAFVFVVQEKSPPYLVTVAEVDVRSLEAGRFYNRQARLIYAECTASGRWPGYSDDAPAYVSLPGWALNSYYEESGL